MVRPFLLVLVAALVVVGSASARNPRLEQLRLARADMELARSAVVRASDLGTGWAAVSSKAEQNAAPDCPWQDYSAYTITGQAQTQFRHQQTSVFSRVEVYLNRKHALGDFGVDLHAGTARCEGAAIRRQIAQGTPKGTTVALVSARQLAGPKVGDRAVTFRIVLAVKRQGTTLPVYVDLIGFVRGRTAASVVVVSPGKRIAGLPALAATIDSRLQRVA